MTRPETAGPVAARRRMPSRGQTFSSMSNPNFRRYIYGQGVSVVGTWMQIIAQGWLVLQLTGSGTAIGVVVALQTLPMLLLGPYGGVIADRVDKRRLMIGLQSLMGLQALALGVLTITGAVQIWQVYALAILLGLNQCFENPARQAFIMELVGAEHVRNAVSLQSVLNSMARALGPAAAGVIHGDFERGFIRAETVAYDDYVTYRGEAGAREAGKFRVEGKSYEVKDGDVLHFLFNA